MKKISRLLFFGAFVLVMLTSCNGGNNSTIEPSAPVESAYSVPDETCSAIRHKLFGYFYSFDENSVVSVSDFNGALDISLYYDGMVLRVPFADYANALAVQSKELATEYGEDIYKISVLFTGGRGKFIAWDSYDGISGELTDTYEGKKVVLSDQTIEDLVSRYGCMDWFYTLSDSSTGPDIQTEPASMFGDMLDAYQGTWGNSGAWQIVICKDEVYYVCYDDGGVVEIKKRHFCFDDTGNLAIATLETPEYFFTLDDSGHLVSEKIKSPITNTYEKISDDTNIPTQ